MKQYELSKNFISEIFRSSGGFIPLSDLDKFFNALEDELNKSYFTQTSENNLLRVINSFFDKNSLIKDSVQFPHYIEILIAAAVNSNYICDILVRDPEFFYWIVNPSNLTHKPSAEVIEKNVFDLTIRYKTFGSKTNALKSFRRKEILRIAVQDLQNISSLTDITQQLSTLARLILDNLFQICVREVERKYNLKLSNKYCIVSLGKLGGRELNYSSDTDLMIFYDREKKYGSRLYSEILTEVVKLFIETSSRLTDNGYLYRIDFRLRPDGRNSALCRPIQEYLNYYESRGESWERQMLIKSDFMSGDKQLYKKFKDYLQPFIYPVSPLTSPVEQVKKLKTAIEKGLKSDLNIKLSKGGIRDIEFSVQVLQLLYGGKLKQIRQSNTLNAIDELHKAKLISDSEEKFLVKAYVLFRKIEHYLQLMNDRQVHTIPEAGEVINKMAYYLGYNDRDSFLKELNIIRDNVRRFYHSIIPDEGDIKRGGSLFRNQQQASKDLEFLREGKEITGGRSFDQKTQDSFNKIEPVLLHLLSELPDPDLTLKNLAYFIKTSGIPSIWYNEFKDENFLKSVCLLCQYNTKGMNLLYSNTELQDFLLSRRIFGKYKLNDLIGFDIRKLLLYLSSGLALKLLSQEEVSMFLSSVISFKVKQISEEVLGSKGYFIAALGSLGSKEMTFSSDLDLLFITSGTTRIIESKFKELLKKINEELGFFKADCRLRPEGKTSQLAWQDDAYIKYLHTRGRIWELQALCKLEYISGDKRNFNKIVKAISERINKEDCKSIKQNVYEMKKKVLESGISSFSRKKNIKRTSGGITDIEYVLQSLILCSGDLYNLCRGRRTSEIIDIIWEHNAGILPTELKGSYNFLKSLEMNLQFMFDTDKTYFPSEAEKTRILSSFYEKNISELEKEFQSILKLNSALSEKILNT